MSLRSCLFLKTQIWLSLEKNFVVRCYGTFSPRYVDPIPKEYQENLTAEERSKLLHVPVKCARKTGSASVFHHPQIAKFESLMMKKGERAKAREFLSKTFYHIKRMQLELYHNEQDEAKKAQIILDPAEVFHEALKNTTPLLQLVVMIRAGTNYQVPTSVSEEKATFMAMKWLIPLGWVKGKKGYSYNLARGIIEASKNTGTAVKLKENLHRQCEANRVYAHFRWS